MRPMLDHPGGGPLATPLARKHAQYAETRDPQLRDELVDAYRDLAINLSGRFAQRLGSRDDLVQVALIGLLGAVERYDPTRGIQFSTFATATILGELKRHFRDRAWTLRPPRRVQEAYLAAKSSVAHLTQELSRTPTIPEIADDAGFDVETVIEAIEAGRNFQLLSLDTPVGPGDDAPRLSHVGANDPGFAAVETRQLLSRLLVRLPDRERRIVQLRFVDNLTQAQIAAELGISQIHVSRLLARTLATLRVWAGEGAAAS